MNALRSKAGVARLVALALLVVAFASVPYTWFPSMGLLPGPSGSASSMLFLGVIMVVAALAVSYGLLLGQAGLLSMSHGLYFGMGMYGLTMLLIYTELEFLPAAALTLVIVSVFGLVLNVIALRIDGVPYAMVTLAFVEVGATIVDRNYFGSGGETGLRLPSSKVPDALLGLRNAANVYWLCLALVVLVVAVTWLIMRSQFGVSVHGTRDNALRMRVLGYDVYWIRLVVSLVATAMAGACGIVFAVVIGGTDPHRVGLTFALSLILMVVIGGSRSISGALVGGAVYMFLTLRMPALGATLEASGAPDFVGSVLGEPSFLLGMVFLLVVFVAPKGLVGLFTSAQKKQ